MSTHNKLFHDELRTFLNTCICFLELSEEFRRDSKTSWNYPW